MKALIDAAIDALPEDEGLTEAQVRALIDAALKEANTSEGGCGSSIGIGGTVLVLLPVALIAAAIVIARKKA